MTAEEYMRMAIRKAFEGLDAGQTPFGACIVKSGEVIACEHNVVWATTDITAHAEVTALRAACRKLGSIDLSGCIIYSTCEPCPMCFSACHWARVSGIVFGAGIADARECGFSELTIPDTEMARLGGSTVRIEGGLLREEALELFKQWRARPDPRLY